jgi:hypothetical protein
MMKVIVLALLELALWCICSGAFGQDVGTAGRVAGNCEHVANTIGNSTTPPDYEDGICIGTIAGWRDTIDALPVLTPDWKSVHHVEKTATNGQLIRVFYLYVKAHPEMENKRDFLVFLWALEDGKLLTVTPIRKGTE